MREIESKFLDIDTKRVEAALLRLGAKKTFEGPVDAVFLDFSDRRMTRKKAVVRVRKVGEESFITLKTPLQKGGRDRAAGKAKAMEEHETRISSFDTAVRMFSKLGLMAHKRLKKKRTSYSLGKVHFEIDKHPGIPAYLEIEAPDAATIRRYAARIGLDPRSAKSWNSFDVLKHYKERKEMRRKK